MGLRVLGSSLGGGLGAAQGSIVVKRKERKQKELETVSMELSSLVRERSSILIFYWLNLPSISPVVNKVETEACC